MTCWPTGTLSTSKQSAQHNLQLFWFCSYSLLVRKFPYNRRWALEISKCTQYRVFRGHVEGLCQALCCSQWLVLAWIAFISCKWAWKMDSSHTGEQHPWRTEMCFYLETLQCLWRKGLKSDSVQLSVWSGRWGCPVVVCMARNSSNSTFPDFPRTGAQVHLCFSMACGSLGHDIKDVHDLFYVKLNVTGSK